MPPFMPLAGEPALVVPPVVDPLPVVCAIVTPGIIKAAADIDVRIRILLSCLLKAEAFASEVCSNDFNANSLI